MKIMTSSNKTNLRIIRIMKILRIHMINTKIMKILEIYLRNTKIMKILKKSNENCENRENHSNPIQNHENY